MNFITLTHANAIIVKIKEEKKHKYSQKVEEYDAIVKDINKPIVIKYC